MKKILYFILLLSLLFVCGCKDPKDPITLTYESSEIEINVGETVNITPIINNLTTEAYKLNYELYDEIAVIDEEGNLTAIKEGIIDIVVTIDIEPSAVAYLTVIINGLPEGTYQIVLDVSGGKELDNNVILFEKGQKVELPTPEKEGYIFLGWYENDKLVDEIKNKNYNLTAKWESIDSRVNLDYNLEADVYLSNYETRDELINDLVKDIQSVKGSEYNLQFFKEYDETGYGIFASAPGPKTLFSNEEMRNKWSFVLEYIKSIREEKGLDVDGYDEFISKGSTLTASLSINMEMVGFIKGEEYSFVAENANYTTMNYGDPQYKYGFWGVMTEYYKNNNVYKKDTMKVSYIPDAIKQGYEFLGWYTTSDFNESSKVTSSSKFETYMTLYPKFESNEQVLTINYNYNGGLSKALYQSNGTLKGTFSAVFRPGSSPLPSDEFDIIYYKSDDDKYKGLNRIYVEFDLELELYKIVAKAEKNEKVNWPISSGYIITVSSDDLFNKLNKGDVLITDSYMFEAYSSPRMVSFEVYAKNIDDDSVMGSHINEIPTPLKTGYTFVGWYDDYNNKYENISDVKVSKLTLHALWKFNGRIIGEFEDKSWVVKGDSINLLTTFIGHQEGELVWKSLTPEIATVNNIGTVKGVSEGLAVITVTSSIYSDVNFTFYVTVFNEQPTDILKLLVDSNNATVYTREEIIIGIKGQPGYFYTNIVGGISKLLFEDYVVHDDYYLANPVNKSTYVAEGVEFITFHYAADMEGSATHGGRNLATFNKSNNETGNQASWHYGTGNDGVWYCQTEEYGAWHAGSSKAMTWHDTGIKYKEGDPEFAKITLGKDNYFYLNGEKTKVVNPTKGTELNDMGLAFKVVDGNYYISGCYFNESYRLISSTGGNRNSIGIESSCAEGSDLWLTWQYSAQLCADLLIRYNLPLIRLVGHHFFSGKWCPQPMLEYDMEIWWEFIELVRQQKNLFENYSDYQLSFNSQSEYLRENGRIISLPEYAECVTYDVTYTIGNETKTVTLSTILPSAFK